MLSILDNEWQYKDSDTVSLRYKYLWQEFLKWSINVKIDTFQISNGALKKSKINFFKLFNRQEHLSPQIPNVLRWTHHWADTFYSVDQHILYIEVHAF